MDLVFPETFDRNSIKALHKKAAPTCPFCKALKFQQVKNQPVIADSKGICCYRPKDVFFINGTDGFA
ncbi:hypothetical protein thsrh120_63340 [Rhizobium sp. No.120]